MSAFMGFAIVGSLVLVGMVWILAKPKSETKIQAAPNAQAAPVRPSETLPIANSEKPVSELESTTSPSSNPLPTASATSSTTPQKPMLTSKPAAASKPSPTKQDNLYLP